MTESSQPRALRAALLDLMLHAIKSESIVHMSKHGWLADANELVQLINELPALRVWIHDTRPTSVSSTKGSIISRLLS